MNYVKKFQIFFLTLLIIFSTSLNSFAQTDSPTPTPASSQQASELQSKINDLQSKINDLRGQEKTLSSQIAVMDNQIQLTEYQIASTEQQITDVTLDIDTASKKIDKLQASLNNSVSVLLNRIVATYEVGTIQPLQILLTSNDATDFLSRLNYLKRAQAHDRQLVFQTQQAKVDYTNQKQIFEDKKKQIEKLKTQLVAYTSQLDDEKAAKQSLLAQTKGSESNYQALLSQAQAQLSALSNFARSHVGPGGQIISHQDLSDGWGKYYNQRDANWGNNLMGLSSEQIWDVGCLITSYAMVVTHYGGSISPADVAANSGNFFSNTAYFLKPGPSANGHSASAVSFPSNDDLKNAVNSGNAVIAGLSYDGGPIADHWVVIRGVDGNGNFLINDPLYGGSMNVSINDHYGSLKIVDARIYH